MAYWDTFENRWEITGELVADTGLRVGVGGEAAEPTATDLPVLKDAKGHPYIPGSSLRGVLRSHVERIVRGLETPAGEGRGACNPVQEKEWCITSEQMREWREKARGRDDGDTWLAEQVWTHSCRVCCVFGSPWLASRVRIADLHHSGQAPVQVRDGVAIDREKETVQHKYDFEAVTVGARFGLNITAENLDEEERGLLWLGLRELERGHIEVGGFKGRGLGQVRLENLALRSVETADRQGLQTYLITGKLAEVQPEEADDWLNRLVDSMVGGK
jgi:CRISPR-associated RAMP protein (TIGR02581 family)